MKNGKSRGLVSPSKGWVEGVCCSTVSAGNRDSGSVAGSLKQASDCCVTTDAIFALEFSSTYDD